MLLTISSEFGGVISLLHLAQWCLFLTARSPQTARALVNMMLPHGSILRHSSRTSPPELGDDVWEFCQNLVTETAGLSL